MASWLLAEWAWLVFEKGVPSPLLGVRRGQHGYNLLPVRRHLKVTTWDELSSDDGRALAVDSHGDIHFWAAGFSPFHC